jgi:hypothetical protein
MRRHSSLKILHYGIIYFFKWLKYIRPTHNAIKDQIPCISFAAIAFLKKIVNENMSVYEWGSGGSTLFWSNHTKEVISIEHEKNWFNILDDIIKNQKKTNITYKFIASKADDNSEEINTPDFMPSVSENYIFMDLKNYVQDIDQYPDESFDIVLINGRSRSSCVLHGMRKVKKGGYLILGNSERKHYQGVLQLLEKNEWEKYDFFSPTPYTAIFSCTSFYKKID